jgi:hypothetical protein
MRRHILFLLLGIFMAIPFRVEASYMLPYPSFMPGNRLYTVSRVIDTLKKYWYFGNISKIKYYVSLSDKYLIEAKTLFEYQQYLLAADALVRSGDAWSQITVYLLKAEREGKDVSLVRETLMAAVLEHERVLTDLKERTPKEFVWAPEKSQPTLIPIHEMLDKTLAGIRFGL